MVIRNIGETSFGLLIRNVFNFYNIIGEDTTMAEHQKQYHNERIIRILSSSAANDGQAITLEGNLYLLPTDAKGIVLFAHGSGSSRHSTRNKYVAQVLHNAGIATLLVDLLTPEEE